jgi:hypothetical protein
MGKRPRPGYGSDGQAAAAAENSKLFRGAARPVQNQIGETKPTATILDITGWLSLDAETLDLTRT